MSSLDPSGSSPPVPRAVVFDCNIFIQALLSATGPSAICVDLALKRRVQLLLSDYVIAELREAPDKFTPSNMGVTPEKVDRLVANLLIAAKWIESVPETFIHPIDPDDSHYVNLAAAGNSNLIVSRDRHLIGLMNPSKPWSAEFRNRFSAISVVAPQDLIAILKTSRA